MTVWLERGGPSYRSLLRMPPVHLLHCVLVVVLLLLALLVLLPWVYEYWGEVKGRVLAALWPRRVEGESKGEVVEHEGMGHGWGWFGAFGWEIAWLFYMCR